MMYNIKTGKEKYQGYAHNNSSVRHINTTYFMNLKKLTWARDHLKTSNLSRMTSKKYSTSMGGHLSPRYS